MKKVFGVIVLAVAGWVGYLRVHNSIWHEYVYDEYHCAISFPGDIETSDKKITDTVEGHSVKHGRFILMYAEFPEQTLARFTTDQVYDFAERGFAKSDTMKLVSSNDVMVGSFPGRLCKFQDSDGSNYVDEIVIVDQMRMYQVIFELRSGDSDPDADKFLASFRLLDQPNNPSDSDNTKASRTSGGSSADPNLPKPAANQSVKSAAYLSKLSNYVNQKQRLPKMIDDHTEEMPTKGAEGAFSYRYRLTKVSASEFDSRSFVSRVKLDAITKQCNAPKETGDLAKQGVVIHYAYVDQAGTNITSFDVANDDCP